MPQIISCPQCQKQLQVPEALLGKQIKCSACGAVFVVPGGESAAIAPGPAPSESRAIPCVQCGTKLMVPTSILGKTVKCPKCGTAFTASEGTAPPPLPPPEPRTEASIQPAFEPPPRRPEPVSSEAGDAPHPRSSRWGDDDDEDFVAARGLRRDSLRKPVTGLVLPPAICLLITGILGILVNLFQTVIAFANPELLQQNIFGAGAPPALSGVAGVIFAFLGAGTVVGALCMMRKQWYGLAMTGTILAMINIGNCCCVLGLPFGIWGLVMLCRPDVRDAFSSDAA